MPSSLRYPLVATALAFALAASASAAEPVTPAPAAAPAPAATPAPTAKALRDAAAAFGDLQRQEVERLSTILDTLIADPAFIGPFKARDRETLLARAKPKFDKELSQAGITHWYFIEPEPGRICFLRVHSPALFGDVVERETLSRAIATHATGSGIELGRTAFALRVVKPILMGGRVIGYMELGEEIGDFLVKMQQQSGFDFALLIDKKRVDRKELARVQREDRWNERPDLVMIDSTVWNERLVDLPVPFDKVPEAGVSAGEWADGSRRFQGGEFPVRDASGTVVGVLFVRRELAP